MLHDPALSTAFCEAVTEKLQGEGQPPGIEEEWTLITSAIADAARVAIPPQAKPPRKEWISAGTLDLVGRRKKANSRKRRILTPLIQEALEADWNEYCERFVDQLNAAGRHGNSGKLFRLLKTAAGKRPIAPETMREDNGDLIETTERMLERWKEHFEELLNRPLPPVSMFEAPFWEFLNVPIEPPSLNEVVKAMTSMRSNSAPGEDGVPALAYKHGGVVLHRHLHGLVSKIWEREAIPEAWKTAVVIPIHKKGDRTRCSNYRGISLLDVASKILEAVILGRIRKCVDGCLRENQCGFRPGRSTVDQIFTLRQIIEMRMQHKRPTIVAFIDFKAAFDSVDRSRMYELLALIGLPLKIIRLIERLYAGSKCVVRVGQNTSPEFEVRTGVKQGALLSPTLFNIVLDYVLKEALEGCEGIWIDAAAHVTDLGYADDAALLAETASDMQDMIDRLSRAAAAVGLILSAEKTKIIRTPFEGTPQDPILLNGNPLEDVPSFKYLGSVISMPLHQPPEVLPAVMERIAQARNAFDLLRDNFFCRRRVDEHQKIRIYLAAVRPVLMYGCETMPLRKKDESKMEAFEMGCWRQMLAISYHDRITNEEVLRRLRNPSLCTDELRKRRLSYLGHVMRMGPERLARRALLAEPAANWKNSGGSRQTWRKVVFKDLEPLHLERVYRSRTLWWADDWKNKILPDVCTDRPRWRAMIQQLI